MNSDLRKHIDLVESFRINEQDEENNEDRKLVHQELGDLFDLSEMEDEAFFKEAADALRNECGRLIDTGYFRAVYHHRHQEDLVVKINAGDISSDCNMDEFRIWKTVKGNEDLSDWFAPIVYESPYSWVIHQKKTGDWQPADFPGYVPSFFSKDSDTLAFEQWGSLDGRIVCHDYAGLDLDDFQSWTFVDARADEGEQHIKLE